MSSQINPNSIDSNFPVAGKNQPSAGFRNNFLATQNQFTQAVLEINDLMNKVVVSAPLTYGNSTANVNDLGGMAIIDTSLYNFGLEVYDHGSLTTGVTETFDFELGSVHEVTLAGSGTLTTTVYPINFPDLGYSDLTLSIAASNTSHNISFGNITIENGNVIPGFNANTNVMTFTTSGPHTITLGSSDGSTWELSRKNATAIARKYTPSTSKGALGDTIGQVAYDSSYIYVCTGNYNGTTNIWYRAAVSTSF